MADSPVRRLFRWLRGQATVDRLGTSTQTMPLAEDLDENRARRLAAVLCELGVLLIRAGEITAEIQFKLRDVGAVHGFAVRSFVVPTGVFVRVGTQQSQTMDFLAAAGPSLALDQIQDLYLLADRIRTTAVPTATIRAELNRIRAMPPRFRALTDIAGYAILTAGLGLVQHPGPSALLGYVVLGLLIGTLRSATQRLPAGAVIVPVLAATLVTIISSRWSGPLLGLDPGWMLIPPLIAFLPGASLTMGVMELATRGMVAGVARIADALNVLLLLGFGILLGSSLVHSRPITHPGASWGPWAPWVGVVMLGVGFIIGSQGPLTELPWLLAALVVIRIAQSAATALVTPAFGAFVAGVALPLIATLVARRSRIPTQVTFLPSFWMIVPGAVGLSGITNLLTGRHPNAETDLIDTVVTLAAIALGILIGTSVRGRHDIVVDLDD